MFLSDSWHFGILSTPLTLISVLKILGAASYITCINTAANWYLAATDARFVYTLINDIVVLDSTQAFTVVIASQFKTSSNVNPSISNVPSTVSTMGQPTCEANLIARLTLLYAKNSTIRPHQRIRTVELRNLYPTLLQITR